MVSHRSGSGMDQMASCGRRLLYGCALHPDGATDGRGPASYVGSTERLVRPGPDLLHGARGHRCHPRHDWTSVFWYGARLFRPEKPVDVGLPGCYHAGISSEEPFAEAICVAVV